MFGVKTFHMVLVMFHCVACAVITKMFHWSGPHRFYILAVWANKANPNKSLILECGRQHQLGLNGASNVCGDKCRRIQPSSLHKAGEQSRGFKIVLGCEHKSAPVDSQGPPTLDISVNLHGLPWMDVLVFHKPVRLICTNGDGSHVKGSQLLAYLRKCFTVSSVTTKPKPLLRSNNCPGAP